jgi:hypothetical protein
MSAPKNPPAFPIPDVRSPDGCGLREGSPGMGLREYFAAHALTGLIASGTWSNSGDGFEQFIANTAFNIADAMLALSQERDTNE